MNSPDIGLIVDLLGKRWGVPRLSPTGQPVAELVLTILSQNTSDVNSRPAFKALVARFPTWDQVLQAQTSEVAGTIRAGGLANIKAARIQQALSAIKQQRGEIELDFLAGWPIEQARQWLMDLPGVGNKTAACVLLFALGKPVLPVDTHVFRVAQRLKLITPGSSLDQAHRDLAAKVPPSLVFPFHVLLITHGRSICRAAMPRCEDCVIAHLCPSRGRPARGRKKRA
jgi:endonuclease III